MPPPLPLTVPGSQTRAQAQGDSSEFRPRGAELPASPIEALTFVPVARERPD